MDGLLPDEHVVEGEAVLDDEQRDRDERDQDRLDEEDPLALGGRWAESADPVGDLVHRRRGDRGQVLGMVN